ncbi:TonB-dependent receptor [Crocinitomicaceae bacterium]|nr:TonB-dependent receptor [Crocinitomicaceae bacterium]
MKYIIALFFLCIFSIVSSQAKNHSISGFIITHNKSVNGQVSIKNLNQNKTANEKGYVKFENIPNGIYYLNIHAPGYTSIEDTIQLKGEDIVDLFYELKENVTQLPEVFVGSESMTGGELGIRKLPGSAYYISPLEIEKFNYSDIHCVLKSIPGVNIQEEDGYGLRPNIGLRGSGVSRSSKITLMEDGILMAPAPYCAPSAYYFPTTGRMYAVEVLKGSSQIKYGPFTTGGALNLISTPIPQNLSGKININGGSFWGRNIHGYIGNTHGNFGYLVESFNYGSNGFKQLDNGGNTGFNKNDFITKFQFTSKADARINQSILIKLGYCQETSNETYVGLTDNDFEISPYRRYAGSQMDVMNSTQNQLSLTHKIKPRKGLNLVTTFYRNNFQRNWYKLSSVRDSLDNKVGISSILSAPDNHQRHYDLLTGTSSVSGESFYVKGNNRSYYAQGIQSALNMNFKTGQINHEIQVGIRYHQDEMDRFQNQDQYSMNDGVMFQTSVGELGTESNRVRSAYALASHIQYNLKYNNLDITPGLRYEKIDLKEVDYGKADPERQGIDVNFKENAIQVFVPGIGINYSLNSKTSIYGGIHKGFAPPGVTEGSLPEKSINYELGTKHFSPYLNFQTVLFYTDYKNLLGNDLAATGGNGSGTFYNGGAARTLGVELFATMRTLKMFKVKSKFTMPMTLSYTYTNAEFSSSFESDFESWGNVYEGYEFPYLAKHQVSGRLSLCYDKLEFYLNAKYNSTMRAQAGNDEISLVENIPGYLIVDGVLKYHINEKICINLNIQNLTNKAYVVALRPAGLRPGLPRIIQFGINANL